jgi:hypothetical protein
MQFILVAQKMAILIFEREVKLKFLRGFISDFKLILVKNVSWEGIILEGNV